MYDKIFVIIDNDSLIWKIIVKLIFFAVMFWAIAWDKAFAFVCTNVHM